MALRKIKRSATVQNFNSIKSVPICKFFTNIYVKYYSQVSSKFKHYFCHCTPYRLLSFVLQHLWLWSICHSLSEKGYYETVRNVLN